MESLTRLCTRRPRSALIVLALITVALGGGALRLRTDVGYRAFLGPDHPAVRTFDSLLESFGGGLPVAIVWSCDESRACDGVFDSASLAMAYALALDLAATPGVRRVESPATTALLVPAPDGFDARRFVVDGSVATDVDSLAARALHDPLWVGNLVSSDGRVGAIVAELSSSESELNLAFFEVLRAGLAPFEARGFRYHLVGGPVDFVVAAGELERATQRLIPLVALLLTGLLWLLVRSLAAVLAVMATLGLAVVWTLSTLGWLGWPQNTITQMLPPLVLVVGACNGIHVLARYAAELRTAREPGGEARRAALVRAAGDVGGACVVASLTTAAGFASFATSGMESFVRFGIVAAAGVLYTLLLSFTLLPILLARLPPSRLPSPGATALWESGVGDLVSFVQGHARTILVLSALLAVVSSVGVLRLKTDASFEALYGEQSQVVRWVHFVEEHLRAPETLEIGIELPGGQRAESPAVLAEVAELEQFLASLEGLGPVTSIRLPLGRMNRLLNDDDPAFERTGDTARVNASLLFLLTADDAHRLDPWISTDHRRLRVSAQASKVPEDDLRELLGDVRRYLEDELPEDWGASVTGAASLVHEMVREIKRTQYASFATAALVVLVLVAIFLRSPGMAVLAMIPTALPVVLTLGAMGFLGLRLDVGSAMVAAVVIGVAIDDTVHLLVQYRRRLAAGLPPGEAVRSAVAHVARALITTSVALAVGFASLSISPWDSVASFGIVSSVAILAALVADLIVLPALILSASRFKIGEA